MWTLIIGLALMAFTVGVHAVGAAWWLNFIVAHSSSSVRKGGLLNPVLLLLSTSTALLVLHTFQALVWAAVFMLLPDRAGLENFPDAIYFSMITFTTLGYGDITLNSNWQLLAGMEAMVGITVFGLTTAILYAVIQRLWKISHPHAD